MPNNPWVNLMTEEVPEADENDINFDVDQKFKFRMPTGENFKGKDVKFNVKLPKDLLGKQTQPAARRAPAAGPQLYQDLEQEEQEDDLNDDYYDEEDDIYGDEDYYDEEDEPVQRRAG